MFDLRAVKTWVFDGWRGLWVSFQEIFSPRVRYVDLALCVLAAVVLTTILALIFP